MKHAIHRIFAARLTICTLFIVMTWPEMTFANDGDPYAIGMRSTLDRAVQPALPLNEQRGALPLGDNPRPYVDLKYATARPKDPARRQAKGKKMFIVTMSMAGVFTAVALGTGLAGRKQRMKSFSNHSTTLSLVGLGIGIYGAGTSTVLGVGVGLPLWKAKGKHAPGPISGWP